MASKPELSHARIFIGHTAGIDYDTVTMKYITNITGQRSWWAYDFQEGIDTFSKFKLQQNKTCNLISLWLQLPMNIPSNAMVPYNRYPLGIPSLAYSTTLNLMCGINAQMISTALPCIYWWTYGVLYVEKMPTSLWLLHKGSLMHCCLCIILLLPHTHTYSSLLLSAIFFLF